MSLLNELKNRNVIKVAIAYIVTAWLILQVVDVVILNIAAPAWVFQTILLLVIIGFPLALVFAWAFEVTPQGIRREPTAEKHLHSLRISPGKKTDPVEHSIAVLPFVNMSDDPDTEYFSDGLSEEILNLLGKIKGLKVIARTSSFAFKNKNEDLREIGNHLGVNNVLEGSVRKSGSRIRITVQLIEVENGTHIWSKTYDRKMTEIFEVQDDVAAAITHALRLFIGPNPSRGQPTTDTVAYAMYLKARAARNTFDFPAAEKYLLAVIERDPDFAEAYELIAHCYWDLAGNDIAVSEARTLIRKYAAKALDLNKDLPFALALFQSADSKNYSYLRSVSAFELAARAQPNNPAPLDTLIINLQEAGYFREALDIADTFINLDPMSPNSHVRYAETLYGCGRTDEALASLQVADDLGSKVAKRLTGAIHFVAGDDNAGVVAMQKHLEEAGLPYKWVKKTVESLRDPNSGQTYLETSIPEIVAQMPVELVYTWERNLTGWYLIFGYLDKFFEIINAKLTSSTWTDADAFVTEGTIFRRTGFTSHKRYIDVARALNIVELWDQRGAPDFAKKIGGKWVCE